MELNEKLARVIQVNESLRRKGEPESCLWPALVGNTGVGKTRAVRMLARSMGKEVQPLILSHTLPEDIGGVLRVIDGRAEWILPSWAHKDCVLFLDEIDKAPRDVVAAVLSLLTSRELRGQRVHEGIVFIAAMQPPEWDASEDETTKALVARLALFGVPESNGYSWVHQMGLEVPSWCANTVDLPHLHHVSPRQARWIAECAEIWGDDIDWAIEAVVSPRNRQAIKSWLARSPISVRAWMRAFIEDVSLVGALPITECVRLAHACIEHGDETAVDAFCACIEKIAAHAGEDEVRALTTGIVQALDRKAQGASEVNVFGTATEEEVADKMARAIARGGRVRAQRIENENR